MKLLDAIGKAILAFVAIVAVVLTVLFVIAAIMSGPAWVGPAAMVIVTLSILTACFYEPE